METTQSEGEQTVKAGYEPSNEQMDIVKKHFNLEHTIFDPKYNSSNIGLSQVEANRRAELVSDIEYTFSLALKKGNNYLGQAEINFYIE